MNAIQTAAAMIRSNLGLTAPPSEWTYEQRLAYNNALAVFVQNNSQSFSPEELLIAQGVSAQNPTALDDVSFLSELSDFGGEVGNNVVNAGGKIAGIGEGVLDFAGMLKWLIPLAGLALVGIFVWSFYKKTA